MNEVQPWYFSSPLFSFRTLSPLTLPSRQSQGLYYSGILIGPAVAPAIAGVLTEYVPNEYGWRAMQWLLFGMGVVASLLSLLCFPETIHEKGIVAIKRERRREREERGEVEFDKEGKGKLATWWGESTFLWLNPLAPLRLLMLPHIAAMVRVSVAVPILVADELLTSQAINSSFVLLSTYSILVPLSQTIAPRYNITNSAVLGCFYIAQGPSPPSRSRAPLSLTRSTVLQEEATLSRHSSPADTPTTLSRSGCTSVEESTSLKIDYGRH